jgi:predicted DNA-binding protein
MSGGSVSRLLEQALYDRLKAYCQETGMGLHRTIRGAVSQYLDQYDDYKSTHSHTDDS